MTGPTAVAYEGVDTSSDKEALAPDMKDPWGPYTHKKCFGQVTVRVPINPHPLNLLALTYGFLPWMIPIGLGIYGIATWHFIPLYTIAMSLVLAIINEGIFKPIMGQPRPKETGHVDKDGKPKNGMPSGHVLNASSIMVYTLLEVALRGPGLGEHEPATITWLIVILLLSAPVPWARWFNWDHTLAQTMVSLVIGTIVGIVAFYLRVQYFSNAWQPWQDTKHPVMAHLTHWAPPWIATTTAPSHGSGHGSKHSLLLL